jgi:hypothetical protein
MQAVFEQKIKRFYQKKLNGPEAYWAERGSVDRPSSTSRRGREKKGA